MLHAAAMVLSFCAIWLLWTLHWRAWDHVAIGFAAALVSVAFALRAAPASTAFSEAAKKARLWLGKVQLATSGVFDLARAALGVGAAPQPALVQLKRRGGEGASLAMHLGAMPGIVHLDSDEESLLFHVMNEEAHEVMMLAAVERGAST